MQYPPFQYQRPGCLQGHRHQKEPSHLQTLGHHKEPSSLEAKPSPETESFPRREIDNTSSTTCEPPPSFYEPPTESESELAPADMYSESNYATNTDSRPAIALIRPRCGQQQQPQKPSAMTAVSTRAHGVSHKEALAVPNKSEDTLVDDLDEEQTLAGDVEEEMVANSMDEEGILSDDVADGEHAADGLANSQASGDEEPTTKAIRKTARSGRVDQSRGTGRPSGDLQTSHQRKFQPTRLAVVVSTVVSEDEYGITIISSLKIHL
ncbi:hypothetical protein KCU71_g7025, partial [Aureobasidium melanogenum]